MLNAGWKAVATRRRGRAADVEGRGMAGKEPNLNRVEAQVMKWAAELGRLAARAEREMAKAKKDYYEEIHSLRRDMEGKLEKWGVELDGMKAKAGAMGAEARQTLETLRRAMDAFLKTLGPEIEGLKARAGTAKAEAKRRIGELREARKVARARVKKLKGAGDEAWGEIRGGIERAWGELKAAMESALSKFK